MRGSHQGAPGLTGAQQQTYRNRLRCKSGVVCKIGARNEHLWCFYRCKARDGGSIACLCERPEQK